VELADAIARSLLDRVGGPRLIGQATRASEQERACVKRVGQKANGKNQNKKSLHVFWKGVIFNPKTDIRQNKYAQRNLPPTRGNPRGDTYTFRNPDVVHVKW
jgi:hypothetical protein